MKFNLPGYNGVDVTREQRFVSSGYAQRKIHKPSSMIAEANHQEVQEVGVHGKSP